MRKGYNKKKAQFGTLEELKKYQIDNRLVKEQDVIAPPQTGRGIARGPLDVALHTPVSNLPQDDNWQEKTAFHPAFQAINALAIGATAIGGGINNRRAVQDEQEQYQNAIDPRAYENMERYSFNTNPAYTKAGGEVKQAGGGVYEYLQKRGLDGSFASRKKLFSDLFKGQYKGTAEQNNYLMSVLEGQDVGDAPAPSAPKGKIPADVRKATSIGPATVTTTRLTPENAAKQSVQNRGIGDVLKGGKLAQAASTARSTRPSTATPNIGGAGQYNAEQVLKDIIGRSKSTTNVKKAKQAVAQGKAPLLQSGMVVDKRSNNAYVVKDGKVTTSFPVLTSGNPDAESNLGVSWDQMTKDKSLKATPSGGYFMRPSEEDIYGSTGFYMDPIATSGQFAPASENMAIHQTYDPANRDKLYNMSAKDRNASYGCINCQKPNLDLIKSNFAKGDTLMVIDPDKGQTLESLGIKKYGGGKYQVGGRVAMDPHVFTDNANNDTGQRWASKFQNVQIPQKRKPLGAPGSRSSIANSIINEQSDINPNSNPSVQIEEYDFSQPTDFSYTYPSGGYNQQKSLYFPDAGSLNAFTKNQSPISTTTTNNGVTSTGYIKNESMMPRSKYQVGGKVAYTGTPGQTYQTQAELDAEQAWLDRKWQLSDPIGKGIRPMLGKKIGDPVLQVSGQGFAGYNKPLATTWPKDAQIFNEQGATWYNDPATGDVIDIDPQAYAGSKGVASQSMQNYDLAKRNGLASRQAGGSVGQVQGLVGKSKQYANVEAEAGEVIEGQNGSIYQIDPQGNTHEEGGEFIPNVQRVLENTSDMRKDKNSKDLRLDPKQVLGITGFAAKSPMSHAKALLKADEAYEKQRDKIVKNITLAGKNSGGTLNKYAENSTKLNMEHFKAIPTKDMLFENLFNHQETLKANLGIDDSGKGSKYGGSPAVAQAGTNLQSYKGNRSGRKTPAGNSDAYIGGPDAFNKALEDLKSNGFNYEGITNPREFQQALYAKKLADGQFDDIRTMWADGMHDAGMKRAKEMGVVDAKGNFIPGALESEDVLRDMAELYPDGILGRRTMQLAKTAKTPPRIFEDTPAAPAAPATPQLEEVPDTSITNTYNNTRQPQSRFNEPLRWFDVASPVGTYLSAVERQAEKYNPAEFSQLRYKLQDPTVALQQNQADFNASVQAIQSSGSDSGTSMANIANMASRKYALNNQVIGQYENQNAQIKNNEILYNTQVRDRQAVSDQQSRETFENKVLTGKAKQTEQKLTALDSLYKTIAENRALNRNGNLMMKFSRAFDQYGDYNGYQTKFQINPQAGMSPTQAPVGKGNPAGGIQGLTPGKSYYNRLTGKTLRFDGVSLVPVS